MKDGDKKSCHQDVDRVLAESIESSLAKLPQSEVPVEKKKTRKSAAPDVKKKSKNSHKSGERTKGDEGIAALMRGKKAQRGPKMATQGRNNGRAVGFPNPVIRVVKSGGETNRNQMVT